MKKKIGICWITLILATLYSGLCFAGEEHIILGKEERWLGLAFSQNIILKPGKDHLPDIALKDSEYSSDPETDLLLHFNSYPFRDETANYKVIKDKIHVSPKNAFLGQGAAVYQLEKEGLVLQPAKDSLFFPLSQWMDFTIEFWFYPANLDEGSSIFLWRGTRIHNKQIIPQEVRCFIKKRQITWNFQNFFLPADEYSHEIEIASNFILIPKTWHHHMLRFDSSTGLIEYSIDGLPEAIGYASKSGREDGTVYFPQAETGRPSTLIIGDALSGFLDELRISRALIEKPQLNKYNQKSGLAITKILDLDYANSRLSKIQASQKLPKDTAIKYYYYLAKTKEDLKPNDERWISFEPDKQISTNNKGRYLQIMFELFPSADGMDSPAIHELTIAYEPDLPPPPPVNVTATPGNGQVKISWEKVVNQDIQGYLIYYGENPGEYFGTKSVLGPSPLDVGNVNTVVIGGLTNGKLYFFSVISYDSSWNALDSYTRALHTSLFSQEVSARPLNRLMRFE